MVKIIEYEDKYAPDFRRLNMEWLEKYNLIETHDLELLNDPQEMILNQGGFIYLAAYHGEIVGSAGLMKAGESAYELVKMAVSTDYRGKGIGKLLIQKCLDKARETGAQKIMLYSNSQLQTAIALYSKFGFRHVPVINAPFVTADVRMEYEF